MTKEEYVVLINLLTGIPGLYDHQRYGTNVGPYRFEYYAWHGMAKFYDTGKLVCDLSDFQMEEIEKTEHYKQNIDKYKDSLEYFLFEIMVPEEAKESFAKLDDPLQTHIRTDYTKSLIRNMYDETQDRVINKLINENPQLKGTGFLSEDHCSSLYDLLKDTSNIQNHVDSVLKNASFLDEDGCNKLLKVLKNTSTVENDEDLCINSGKYRLEYRNGNGCCFFNMGIMERKLSEGYLEGYWLQELRHYKETKRTRFGMMRENMYQAVPGYVDRTTKDIKDLFAKLRGSSEMYHDTRVDYASGLIPLMQEENRKR